MRGLVMVWRAVDRSLAAKVGAQSPSIAAARSGDPSPYGVPPTVAPIQTLGACLSFSIVLYCRRSPHRPCGGRALGRA